MRGDEKDAMLPTTRTRHLCRRRMQQQTEDHLDQWWAERFSVDQAGLWRSFTAMR